MKQRCTVLEDQLVDLVVTAMERSENEEETKESSQLLWQHLSSQLIFFVLFQFASFPHMVLSLYDKVRQGHVIIDLSITVRLIFLHHNFNGIVHDCNISNADAVML